MLEYRLKLTILLTYQELIHIIIKGYQEIQNIMKITTTLYKYLYFIIDDMGELDKIQVIKEWLIPININEL